MILGTEERQVEGDSGDVAAEEGRRWALGANSQGRGATEGPRAETGWQVSSLPFPGNWNFGGFCPNSFVLFYFLSFLVRTSSFWGRFRGVSGSCFKMPGRESALPPGAP